MIITDSFREKYVGKEIQLYPGDTISKYGFIKDVDELGWTIEISNVCGGKWSDNTWEPGNIYFISHSTNFIFRFIQ